MSRPELWRSKLLSSRSISARKRRLDRVLIDQKGGGTIERKQRLMKALTACIRRPVRGVVHLIVFSACVEAVGVFARPAVPLASSAPTASPTTANALPSCRSYRKRGSAGTISY